MVARAQEIFGFPDSVIGQGTVRDGKLLSIELEFTSRCNLRCLYCYTGKDMFRNNELEIEEMADIVSQAKALGARKIIYLGAGEPLLDQKLMYLVHYVHKLKLDHVLFTNATLINANIAKELYDHNVSVVVKQTSQNPQTYNLLSGVEDAYADMMHGMECLRAAGYPDKDHHLGIEAIISKHNINEIPVMWRWARQRDIIPYFECLTYQGKAINHSEIYATNDQIKALFEQLSQIDATEFGYSWQPHPPIAAFSCKRHLYSCVVNSQGYVQPCVGVNIKVGNIRNKQLADILRESKPIQELSRIREHIKGHCRTCSLSWQCYGCRGTAYNLTGDYLASDPTCWRASNEAAVDIACSKK